MQHTFEISYICFVHLVAIIRGSREQDPAIFQFPKTRKLHLIIIMNTSSREDQALALKHGKHFYNPALTVLHRDCYYC